MSSQPRYGASSAPSSDRPSRRPPSSDGLASLLQALHGQSRLGPAELIAKALSTSRTAFAGAFEQTPFLVIATGEAGSPLGQGLLEASLRAGNSVPRERGDETVTGRRMNGTPSIPVPRPVHLSFVASASAGHLFVTPLQKRPNAPDLGVRRILAGRLRGNDIVLIHDTVSKFHAWFEWTSAGLYLTDADSKNGTTVDDEALRPKEARAVRPGQCIRFGSIYTTLCDAECLWDAVQR